MMGTLGVPVTGTCVLPTRLGTRRAARRLLSAVRAFIVMFSELALMKDFSCSVRSDASWACIALSPNEVR